MASVTLPLIASCSLALSVVSSASPQDAARVVAIRGGHLIDVEKGEAIAGAVIVINGDTIEAVGRDAAIPKGAEVIDLSGETILPGLIDCHTHLLSALDPAIGDATGALLQVVQMSTAQRALLGAANAKEDLDSGITTVRDLGNSGLNGDVALRDAIRAGSVIGPRMQVSTRALSPAGGQFGALADQAQQLVSQEYAVVSGADSARNAVRQAVFDGAQVIKVIVNAGARLLSPDEIKAIVDEAHRSGRPVAAHATSETATALAAEAGVDSIEHGYSISDATLKVMADKKIFLVPTDCPADYYASIFPRWNASAADRKRVAQFASDFAAGNQARLARAIKAGVRIAAGSDAYYSVSGKTRGELSKLVYDAYAASGTSPQAILRAATIDAATLLGYDSWLGSIAPGKVADLIAVKGNPLDNIRALNDVSFVMKAGVVIEGDPSSHARSH
jgi:imidazolonepropionase-like amidohydrolase